MGRRSDQKKSWYAIAEKSTTKGEKVSTVCRKLDKSRAAYYKQMKAQTQQELESHLVHELVLEQRSYMPRLGGKKLYYLLRSSFEKHQIQLGRDRFFGWLKRHDLLVKPKKRYARTTNSHHHFRVHKNLVQQIEISRPDQVWVSDITYLRLQKGFCYLALITDVFSRKIVGYNVSNTLEVKGALKALGEACKRKTNSKTIHHSDRGFQYCSKDYTNLLKKHLIDISMGEVGNCYENALAERVNGILKSEFNLDTTFMNINHALKAVN